MMEPRKTHSLRSLHALGSFRVPVRVPIAIAIVIAIVGAIVGAGLVPTRVAAQTVASASRLPEPPPAYAQTEGLRDDASCRAVAFGNPNVGVTVGDRGLILVTQDGGATWSTRPSSVACRLDDVAWTGPSTVVAVGGGYDQITATSRAVVLVSDDSGQTWRRADDRDLPRIRAVRVTEDQRIVASGDWSHPSLAREFASRDRGQTWQAIDAEDPDARIAAELIQTTSAGQLRSWTEAIGAPTTVRDACRVSANRMVAVGDHGVIAASENNGKTWEVRRGQGRRAGVLVVAGDARSVPWSIVGSETLESRRRVSVLIESDPDPTIDLADQVAVRLGASGADRISADPDQAVTQIAHWIAVIRPTAIVIDQSVSQPVQDALFESATAAGVRRIAVTEELRLVTGSGGTGSGGNRPATALATALHRDALLPGTGLLASDLAIDAALLLCPGDPRVWSRSLKFLYDVSPDHPTGESVLAGLPIDPGTRLAAATAPASRRQLQIVQARMKQTRQIESLLARSGGDAALAKSVKMMLDQTAQEDRLRMAWMMLQAAIDIDQQSDSATPTPVQSIVLDEIASRFSDRSAGRWAKLRLVAIRQSAEWTRLASSVSTLLASESSANGAPAAQSVAVSPFQVPASGIRQVSGVAPLLVPKPRILGDDSARRSNEKPSVAEVDLAWEFHPAVLLGNEAKRARGDDQTSRSGKLQVVGEIPASLRQLAQRGQSPWTRLVGSIGKPSATKDLSAPTSPGSTPTSPGSTRPPIVAIARPTSQPPHLDGRCDDDAWPGPWSPIDSVERAIEIKCAYDDQYVYLAARCPNDAIDADVATKNPRIVRDHDLRAADRMTIRIDTDRDLMTSMQLQVTDARRTHDSIDGNRAWQPTWYVASDRTRQHVTFEIAILRRDLVDLPIVSEMAQTSWFISALAIRGGTRPEASVMPRPQQWIRVVFQD